MARRANSLPMRPIPITPSVLLYSSTPSKFFLSQFFSRMLASACGIFRATQSKSENACSAVETVFPPGALSTTTPRRVAVSTSTLSTPTPARPTTRRRAPAFKTSAVTFVWLRTTSALNSGMILINSVSPKPGLIVISSAPSRLNSSIPRCEIESAIRTFGAVIVCRAGASPAAWQPERLPYNCLASARFKPVLSENDELNGIGQLLSDIRGHAAAEQFRHGGTLRCANNEKIDAERRRKIEDGGCGIFAHGVNRLHTNVAFAAEFSDERHDPVRFRI